jgi:hypothetical protein
MANPNPNVWKYGWKPGQSGNPAGGPRRPHFKTLLEHVAKLKLPKSVMKKLKKLYPDADFSQMSIEQCESFILHMQALKALPWAYEYITSKEKQIIESQNTNINIESELSDDDLDKKIKDLQDKITPPSQ